MGGGRTCFNETFLAVCNKRQKLKFFVLNLFGVKDNLYFLLQKQRPVFHNIQVVYNFFKFRNV